MSMLKARQPTAADYKRTGMTKQAFKNSTDINKLVAQHAKAGTLSHLEQFGGQYGDFSEFDFFEAQLNIAKGTEIFEQLPAEIRKEFGNSPGEFFAFVNDPANSDRLDSVLPALAAPGQQYPGVRTNKSNVDAVEASTLNQRPLDEKRLDNAVPSAESANVSPDAPEGASAPVETRK